jgi:DNA-binding LytR/AlgR family response regulator
MRIAICEDEQIFGEQLKKYLNNHYNSLDVWIDLFSSGEIFLETFRMKPEEFDIIFMDIEMKQLDGITTARRIREYNRDVILIFLTSHLECAVEGYEVDAFRFLTKPVNKEKLVETLQDIERELNNNKILIKCEDRELLIDRNDIISIEARNVTLVIKTTSQFYEIRKTLCSMEEELQESIFYKPHRSFLIHLGHVVSYSTNEIIMSNGERIPISRNKLKGLKEALMVYIKIWGK